MNTQINGADNEISFWKDFIKTQRFKDWCADGKTLELDSHVADFIKEHIPMHGSILDCGSGVVSILNGLLPGNYQLIATDVLGDEYANIFDYKKAGISPVLPIGAEYLPFEDQFDIVMMRNALDHTQNPGLAWEKLYQACKPGGFVILQGFENEANHENWQGMHQWNIAIEKVTNPFYGSQVGEEILCIRSKERGKYYAIVNPFFSQQIQLPNGKSWFTWIIKK